MSKEMNQKFKDILEFSKNSIGLYFNKIEENVKKIDKTKFETSINSILLFYLIISIFYLISGVYSGISQIMSDITTTFLTVGLLHLGFFMFKTKKNFSYTFKFYIALMIPIFIILPVILLVAFLLAMIYSISILSGIILSVIIGGIFFIWITYINLKTYSISQKLSMFKVFIAMTYPLIILIILMVIIMLIFGWDLISSF